MTGYPGSGIGDWGLGTAITSAGVAGLLFVRFGQRRRGGSGDDVLFRGPVAKVDEAAALAAERVLRVAGLDFHLLADGTLHTAMLISGAGWYPGGGSAP